MGHDIATHWLLRIDSVGHAATRVRSHLVRDEDGHIELLRNLLQAAHHLIKHLLAFGQFTTPTVVDPEGSHDTVDHKQGEAVLNHATSGLLQKSYEAVDCEGSTDHDVVEDALGVQVEPVRDRLDTLGSERVLPVSYTHLTLPTICSV